MSALACPLRGPSLFRAGRSAACLLLALAGLGAPAWAASPDVVISVVPVPAVVTYSRPTATPPLVTRAAYEVTITNRSNNTLNEVRFEAATTVQGAAQAAPFIEAIGFACAASSATATRCSIGTLRGKGDRRSFVLLFAAPTAGSAVVLNWVANYSEGRKDSPGASHGDTQTGAATTPLGTPIVTEVRSYIPTTGGSVYTGQTGVATFADPFTTTVQVPSWAKAEVLEAQSAQSCSAAYTLCATSTLTIPGSFAYLTIILRRDASTIVSGANIANAVLRYEPGSNDASGNFVPSGPPVDIISCDLLPDRLPNAANKRCLDYRRRYDLTNSPTIDWKFDWEFGLRALENGRISF